MISLIQLFDVVVLLYLLICYYYLLDGAELRARADREAKRATRPAPAGADHVALVQHVVEALVDVVEVPEHHGLARRHGRLDAVHVLDEVEVVAVL